MTVGFIKGICSTKGVLQIRIAVYPVHDVPGDKVNEVQVKEAYAKAAIIQN